MIPLALLGIAFAIAALSCPVARVVWLVCFALACCVPWAFRRWVAR